jgi:AraC-like DNA-binding protein
LTRTGALAEASWRPDDRCVTYRQYPTVVPQVVLWRRTVASAPKPSLILPDGCLDLLWDGQRLFVAGPDTTARWHQNPDLATYTALRFYGGTGPGLLGVPADELRDQTVGFEELRGSAEARRLIEQVAADPARTLTTWLVEHASEQPMDPLGPRVFAMATAGRSVEQMADRVGLSVRQLHRRCQPLFGYGPRHLTRVLRLIRAVTEAAAGRPLAEVAVGSGYYDQAHLSREVRALAGTTPTGLLSELAG